MNDKLEKLEKIRELGINPYPYSYGVSSSIVNIRKNYDDKLSPSDVTDDDYKIAGRVKSKRHMGKVYFMDIEDENSKLQLFFRTNDFSEPKKSLVDLLDVGDIVGAQGKVFKTKMGELSLWVSDYDLLCKSLKDLGDKYHGVKDVEVKYRNRSLDMVMNPESRQILKKRYLITQKIREFMIKENYLEIETPIVQTVYGGAAAKPFTTHHNDLNMDLYLRVSPEQSLKRVLCGGMEAVFEINKNLELQDLLL